MDDVEKFHVFRYVDDSSEKFERLAEVPTWVEGTVAEAKRKFPGSTFFAGAIPGENIIEAGKMGQKNALGKGPQDLARHKVVDNRADLAVLEIELGVYVLGHFIAIGTGHRDHHIVYGLLKEQILAGEEAPAYVDDLGILMEILDAQEGELRIPNTLYAEIMGRLVEWDNIESKRNRAQEKALRSLKQQEVERIQKKFEFKKGIRSFPVSRAREPGINFIDARQIIENYLFHGNGRRLLSAWGEFLQADYGRFPVDHVSHVYGSLVEDYPEEAVFRVSFNILGGSFLQPPSFDLVISKSFDYYPGFNQAYRVSREGVQSDFAVLGFSAYATPDRPKKSGGRRDWNLSDGEDESKVGIYARRRPSKEPSFFGPLFEEETDLIDNGSDLIFDGFRRSIQRGVEPSDLDSTQVSKVAWSYGKMMARYFLHYRQKSSPHGVMELEEAHQLFPKGVGGWMPQNINFTRDVRFDLNMKASLSAIRKVKMVSAEEFLYWLLHTRFQFDYQEAGDQQWIRKEWQFFSQHLSSLMQGFEEELIETYGEAKGRQIAIQWYEKYLGVIEFPQETGPLSDHIWNVNLTFPYKKSELNPKQDMTTDSIESKKGPMIRSQIDERVNALTKQLVDRWPDRPKGGGGRAGVGQNSFCVDGSAPFECGAPGPYL